MKTARRFGTWLTRRRLILPSFQGHCRAGGERRKRYQKWRTSPPAISALWSAVTSSQRWPMSVLFHPHGKLGHSNLATSYASASFGNQSGRHPKTATAFTRRRLLPL